MSAATCSSACRSLAARASPINVSALIGKSGGVRPVINALRTTGGSALPSVADACEAQVGDRSHGAICEAEPMAIPGYSNEFHKLIGTTRPTRKAAPHRMFALRVPRHG